MSDQMKFPDTWEEFEKHYGFNDIKQAYTFGNLRLIPSFRVQQWLNHLDDIKCKNQSQKNKMEQIATLFGKKLNEEFKVKRTIGDFYEATVVFIPSGLFVRRSAMIVNRLTILEDLLTGEAMIVNE